MQSIRNITRFTYENSDFMGWRVCLMRRGVTFSRYFPDSKYESPEEGLEYAKKALEALKETLNKGRVVNGKLSSATIQRAHRLLRTAV